MSDDAVDDHLGTLLDGAPTLDGLVALVRDLRALGVGVRISIVIVSDGEATT